MNNMPSRFVWPKDFSNKAIGATFFVIFLLNVFFYKYYTPIPLLILIIITSVVFFSLLHNYTVKWALLPENELYKKLFWGSVFYRLIYLGIVYLLTWYYDPDSLPLEMFAADAWRYLDSGTLLSGNIFNGEFVRILSQYWRDQTDWGFSFYLGLVNTLFFNSVLLVKLFNILWGSLTVVFIAKTASLLYTPKHARLTGIIAMLLPSLMWFNAMYLKESLMIFIIVLIFYNTIKMVKGGRFNILSLILILAGVISLFYFRTILAVIVSISLITYLLFNISFTKRSRVIVFVLLLIFIGGIYSISFQLTRMEEIRTQYVQLESGEANRVTMKLDLTGDLKVETAFASMIVAANAFVSPYPSFLNLDERQIGIIAHAPNEITRIIMYYFALISILLLFKYDFKNSALILTFCIGYIVILAITGASYFDRFQLPVVPFMIILMSVGIINSPRKWFVNWNKYLFLIMVATVLWQIFKISIR